MALMRVKQEDGTIAMIPLGIAGNIGGRGIVSIDKTSTESLKDGQTQDTYTITYTDNTTSNFIITNGKSGTSAYSYAKQGGYTGTENEFAEKLAKDCPEKTSQLENDSGFIKSTVTNLAYYYNKDNCYNCQQVDERISAIPKFVRKVVDSLPETGLDETLYLLRKGKVEDGNSNLFEEWIWVVDEETNLGAWELLGSQAISLTDYALIADVPTIVHQTLEYIYPVGAIYISASDVNPAQIFKFGEWEQIKDTFLLAAGDTYSVGDTGGKEKVTLQSGQLPKMGGNFEMHGIAGLTPGSAINKINTVAGHTQILSPLGEIISGRRDGGQALSDSISLKGVTVSFGNDEAHENMPPYLAVYVWKRVS